jgi:hypothetical protein
VVPDTSIELPLLFVVVPRLMVPPGTAMSTVPPGDVADDGLALMFDPLLMP